MDASVAAAALAARREDEWGEGEKREQEARACIPHETEYGACAGLDCARGPSTGKAATPAEGEESGSSPEAFRRRSANPCVS